MIKLFLFLQAFVMAGAALAQQAPAANSPAASSDPLFTSVVKIDTKAVNDAQSNATLGPKRSGSGVIIGPQLVLTIGYLMLEAEEVDVTSSRGKRIPGNVLGYDHATGFGLIKTLVPIEGRILELGDSGAVKEKQKLLTLGQGESESTEVTVISRKAFSASWEYALEKPLFTSPPVNNWSGSALATPEGRLVGIGSLIVNDAADGDTKLPGNMFVPTDLLKPILNDLVAQGRRKGPVQPWLGMTTETIRGKLYVTRLSKEGPAQEAGLNAGDIIVGVGSQKVGDLGDFYKKLWASGAAGTTFALQVQRGEQTQEFQVKSIDRSDFLKKPKGI